MNALYLRSHNIDHHIANPYKINTPLSPCSAKMAKHDTRSGNGAQRTWPHERIETVELDTGRFNGQAVFKNCLVRV